MRQVPIFFLAITLLLAAVLIATGLHHRKTGIPRMYRETISRHRETSRTGMRITQLPKGSTRTCTTSTPQPGNTTAARDALNHAFIANRTTIEFPFNRSEAEAAVREAFPNATEEQINRWLSAPDTARITSDGEELFFYDTVANIRTTTRR